MFYCLQLRKGTQSSPFNEKSVKDIEPCNNGVCLLEWNLTQGFQRSCGWKKSYWEVGKLEGVDGRAEYLQFRGRKMKWKMKFKVKRGHVKGRKLLWVETCLDKKKKVGKSRRTFRQIRGGKKKKKQGIRASLVAQVVNILPIMQETWVQSLGWEDPLEEEMATHSSILA